MAVCWHVFYYNNAQISLYYHALENIMVKKPLTLDHYIFVNLLLDLKDNNRVDPNKEILDKNNLMDQLIEQQKALDAMKTAEAQENALKLQRVIETLNDEKKKKAYDDALKNAPNMELKLAGKEKGRLFVPLVPIEDIISEFNAFEQEMLNLKDKDGKPLFEKGNFKYEKQDGPPEMHVFTFPDQASANAFLERLFQKNMAMFPNGSQSTESIKPQPEPKQAAFKDSLKDLKSTEQSAIEEQRQDSNLTPLKIKP